VRKEDDAVTPELLTFVQDPTQALLSASTSNGLTNLHKQRDVEVMLQAPGTNIDYAATWGPLSSTASLRVPRLAAAHAAIVVVHDELDSAGRTVRIACATTDANFSPRVGSGSCFVKVNATSGQAGTASCSAKSSGVPCEMSLSVPVGMLNNEDLAVYYGLDNTVSTKSNHTIRGLMSPMQVEAEYISGGMTAMADNFVMTLPQRGLYAGESFEVEVVARGDETIALAKFALDLSASTNVLEFVQGTVSEKSSSTWELTTIAPADGVQVFILVKKVDFVAQPGNNADQEVLTLTLRVKSNLAFPISEGDVRVGLRVYEFGVGINPEVAPGGVSIPAVEGGWVHGSVVGRAHPSAEDADGGLGVYLNRPGFVHVRDNSAVGLVAQVESGKGEQYNIAALTGTSSTEVLRGYGCYAFGQFRRT